MKLLFLCSGHLISFAHCSPTLINGLHLITSNAMKNKLIYVQKSPAAMRAPKLKGRMKILVACEDGALKSLPIPKSCRAVVSEIIQFFELDILSLLVYFNAIHRLLLDW